MVTCEKCAKLGSDTWLPRSKEDGSGSGKRKVSVRIVSRRPKEKLDQEFGEDIVEGFGSLIKNARERMGLSHDDLGRKVGEKASVIRRIEAGKMMPDEHLTLKLEHVLKIELHTSVEEKAFSTSQPASEAITLGEIAVFKTNKEGFLKDESGSGDS